jgi:hypothetical protein
VFSTADATATVNLIRKRDNIELIIQQSTQGSASTVNNSFVSTTLTECLENDQIYVYLADGICKLNYGNATVEPDSTCSFSGARISN